MVKNEIYSRGAGKQNAFFVLKKKHEKGIHAA